MGEKYISQKRRLETLGQHCICILSISKFLAIFYDIFGNFGEQCSSSKFAYTYSRPRQIESRLRRVFAPFLVFGLSCFFFSPDVAIGHIAQFASTSELTSRMHVHPLSPLVDLYRSLFIFLGFLIGSILSHQVNISGPSSRLLLHSLFNTSAIPIPGT